MATSLPEAVVRKQGAKDVLVSVLTVPNRGRRDIAELHSVEGASHGPSALPARRVRSACSDHLLRAPRPRERLPADDDGALRRVLAALDAAAHEPAPEHRHADRASAQD